MLDFSLSLIKGTYLFSFGFYKIIKFESAMDDTASILINTGLSKNYFTITRRLKGILLKIHLQKYHTKRKKRVKKKPLDNQNVLDVPFKQTDRQHNIFPTNILETRT